MSAWVRGRNLIDVGSGLGRGLEKRTAPPLSKMLALLSGHLSLRCQVHLVGDQHYVDENIYELWPGESGNNIVYGTEYRLEAPRTH
jgi:hypothetical protein